MSTTSTCRGPECTRLIGRHGGRGFCSQHLIQLSKGKPLAPIGSRTIRKLLANPDMPGTLLVPLTRGYFAIIDEQDGDAVGRHGWVARVPRGSRTVYAFAAFKRESGKWIPVRLHRFIWKLAGRPATPEIDHHNTNGLDCRRQNLRAATRAQNKANVAKPRNNTSGFKGVHHEKDSGRWFARVTVNGTIHHLGSFDTKEEAAAARAAALPGLHGEFARAS